VQRIFVFLSPYGDRLQPELVGGTENADGDFGTIGDEDFGDRHEAGFLRRSLRKQWLAREILQRNIAGLPIRERNGPTCEHAGPRIRSVSRFDAGGRADQSV
jgi:hypothetical protein